MYSIIHKSIGTIPCLLDPFPSVGVIIKKKNPPSRATPGILIESFDKPLKIKSFKSNKDLKNYLYMYMYIFY